MRITGALVFGEDNSFYEKDINIKDGIITSGASKDQQVIDASDCYAIPGLIDIHFHGAVGCDVCDGSMEAFEKIARYEAKRGITAICPATLTLPVDHLKKVLALGAEYTEKDHEGAADLVGFNMEGPFISRQKKGAQNPEYIKQCSVEILDEFIEASKGLLKIAGLAPEENPGYREYIEAVKDKVKVSLAHTGADYEVAMKAFEAGASHAVHLYNAMTGMSHREPGVVGAVYDSKHVSAELICDGIHIHPSVVRATFDMMGDRIILISDSLRCTGMPDGSYQLGGLDINKNGKECRLIDGGAIAGSVTDLTECLRTVVMDMGVPLERAVAAATVNPARCLGVEDRYGALKPGMQANILLLRKSDLTLKAVYLKGALI